MIKQLAKFFLLGIRHTYQLAKSNKISICWVSVWLDGLVCLFRYGVDYDQYFNKKLYQINGVEKKQIAQRLGVEAKKCRQWQNDYNRNWKFLYKYSSLKYDKNIFFRKIRNKAFIKKYKMGEGCYVQSGITFVREHELEGELIIGNNVLFTRNVEIDFTGNVKIDDNVRIAEGVKILSHNHQEIMDECSKNTIQLPLHIRDGAFIGARSIILPGVTEIGRCSYISAGSVVKSPVPPYAIVIGNPAHVIGFKYPILGMIEYEAENYSESERIPEEILRENYQKHFVGRISQIKQFLNI